MREENASPEEANFPGTSELAGGSPPVGDEHSFFVAFPQDAMLRIVALRLSYIRPLRGREKRQRRDKQQHRASEAPPYVAIKLLSSPVRAQAVLAGTPAFAPTGLNIFFSEFVGRCPTLLLTAPLALFFRVPAKKVEKFRS